MRGKKEILSRVLDRFAVFSQIGRLRRDVIVIFGHHRLSFQRGERAFADDVFGQTADEFEVSLRWLKRNVHIMSESELIESIDARRSPRHLSVMLTFDDAYRDHYDIALPILRLHRVPATLFVPTRLVDRRELGWWDLIAFTLKNTRLPEITVNRRTFRLPAERAEAIAHCHKVLQLEPSEETQGLVEELAERCQVSLPSPEARAQELMTWDQIREASKSGVTIGSHTHSHRVLATLDEDTQRAELQTSKRILEEKVGVKVRSIAYPVGGYQHFSPVTQRLAQACGYELGYSFCTGINHFSRMDRFDVRRIGPPNSPSMIAGTAVLPEVFDWDKPAYSVA